MNRLMVVLVLGVSLSLAGCARDVGTDDTAVDPSPPGSSSPPGPSASSSPTSTSSPPEDALSDPPLTGKPDAFTTVSGVLASGVEAGCLLLETGTETLQLLGAPFDLAPVGARVVVTGSRAPQLMTTCQQGVPFRVRDLRPAD